MELARFFNAMDDLGVEFPGYAQFLVVAAIVFLAVVFVKMGRRSVATQQEGASSLSSRLAEIDPSDYDFEGNRKTIEEQSVDFDAFFSNASRRDKLGGVPTPVDVGLAPQPTDQSETILALPTLADLPSPDPSEPAITRDARDRVGAISSAAEAKLEADPGYVMTEEEKFASSALQAYMFCADGFDYFIKKAPDLPRFQAIADVARTVGAADLEAVIGLQIRLMEITSAPEWRERDPDDERWHPILETCDQLVDLFRQANRSKAGLGRMTTLADAYLAGEW